MENRLEYLGNVSTETAGLTTAKIKKYSSITRPRTKYLSVRLHHFQSHVIKKAITIEHLLTKEQIADIFTKPLVKEPLKKLRNILMSWSPVSSRGSQKTMRSLNALRFRLSLNSTQQINVTLKNLNSANGVNHNSYSRLLSINYNYAS